MTIEPMTGPFGAWSKEGGWVPAPRYVLRRHRVLHLLQEMPPGKLLEIGCGSGALLHDLAGLGHECVATEHSQSAYDLAVQLNAGNPRVTICREIEEAWKDRFNYVLAFEVLEHIEDDLSALRHWASLLQPGGYLMLSVPAHQKKWSATDVGADHFRRYERQGLEQVLTDAGLEVRELEMYGFPLANLIAPLQSLRYRHAIRKPKLVQQAECPLPLLPLVSPVQSQR